MMIADDRDTDDAEMADQSVASHSQSGGVTAHTININSRDPLFEAQLAEMKDLDQFVARKDETELRELFDLPDMLRFNVRLHCARLTKQRDDEANQFFDGGGGRLSLKRVVIVPSSAGGAPKLDPIPGHIWAINFTEKHADNRRKLTEFADSIMLPTEVIEAVKELDGALERNMDLMLDVLDERFRANPKNILEHEDHGSPRLGGVNNAYWHKFEGLKPIANKIGAAIRKHLKVS